MYVVGIDVGGQTSKIGVVDARGTVLAQTVIRTDNHDVVDLFIAELAEAVKKVIKEADKLRIFREGADKSLCDRSVQI